MAIVFIFVLLASVYSYFLYPIFLFLSPLRPFNKKDEYDPVISLIVTCHNEAGRIEHKIKNCLALDYPNEKMEILFASDASSDGTNEIISQYLSDNLKLIDVKEHLGKEYAQLQAIKAARGDILVFSDTATDIPEDAIKSLVKYFCVPEIGAVSSEDRFLSSEGKVVGEGLYVRYEMYLRKLESERAGLVGLSGSFFAARKSICQEWDYKSPSDFNTALNCVVNNKVAVSAPDVLGYYKDVASPQKEYQRKVRTVLRGMTALSRHKEVMNPFKTGWFSFQVISHKLLRWAVPWFLLVLFLMSIVMADKHMMYRVALVCQCAFYMLAALGHYSRLGGQSALFRIPAFFVAVNVAIAHATFLFFKGVRMQTWQPSKR